MSLKSVACNVQVLDLHLSEGKCSHQDLEGRLTEKAIGGLHDSQFSRHLDYRSDTLLLPTG